MSAEDPSQPTPSEDPRLEAPPSLVADLRAAFGAPGEIPRGVERAILQAGRQRAERLGGPRRGWRPWWIGGAAAAAAAVLVLLNLPSRSPSPATELAARPAPALEAGREVDVLHAFQLARLLDEGRADLAGRGWDANGDGRVDGADVETLLDLAVRIDRS